MPFQQSAFSQSPQRRTQDELNLGLKHRWMFELQFDIGQSLQSQQNAGSAVAVTDPLPRKVGNETPFGRQSEVALPLRFSSAHVGLLPEQQCGRGKTKANHCRAEREPNNPPLATRRALPARENQVEHIAGRRRSALRLMPRPRLGISERRAAQQMSAITLFGNPLTRTVGKSRGLLQPRTIRIERFNQCGEVELEVEHTLYREQVNLAQSLRERRRLYFADPHGYEPLVESSDLAQFPVAPFGRDGILRNQPEHRVALANKIRELFLPLLSVRQVPAVNDQLETIVLKRENHRIGNA